MECGIKVAAILTFWELVRPVHVVRAHDDDWQLEALPVRVHHHLRCRLARRVWVCGCQQAGFSQVVAILLHLPVHLVRGNVYELFDPVCLCALKEDVCAVYIGVGELVRVPEAQVDVRLRGEVDDGVYVVGAETAPHVGRGGDVALDEGKVGRGVKDAGVVERCAVVKLVKRIDAVLVGVRQREMADEPARAASLSVSKPSHNHHSTVLWCCDAHEARPSSHHDVARIGQRLELGRAHEHGSLLPYRVVDVESRIEDCRAAAACVWSVSSGRLLLLRARFDVLRQPAMLLTRSTADRAQLLKRAAGFRRHDTGGAGWRSKWSCRRLFGDIMLGSTRQSRIIRETGCLKTRAGLGLDKPLRRRVSEIVE